MGGFGAPAIGTGLGLAAGINGAQQQNAANKRTANSINAAQAAEVQQTEGALAVQQAKRISESNAIRGRLTVVAAESGVGTGGSVAALERQNAYQTALDNNLAEQNTQNQVAAIHSQASAGMTAVAAKQISPLVAAFSGGMAGLSSGLNIAGGVDALNNPLPKDDPARYARNGEGNKPS